MFVVDTNILIHAADQDSPFHAACRKVIEECQAQSFAWYVTWPIVYEFLRVTTHPRVFRQPWPAEAAWRFVDSLLASPTVAVLTATERHAVVAGQLFRDIPHLAGNILHDTHTAVLMREHGISRIFTRDTDFHRFPFLDPIDPVAVGEWFSRT